jgi:hypothetical protein
MNADEQVHVAMCKAKIDLLRTVEQLFNSVRYLLKQVGEDTPRCK